MFIRKAVLQRSFPECDISTAERSAFLIPLQYTHEVNFMPPQRDRWFAFNSCIDRDMDRIGVLPGFPLEGESLFLFSFY